MKDKAKKEMFKDLVFMIIECRAKPRAMARALMLDYLISIEEGERYYWNWFEAGCPMKYIDIFK